MQAALLPRLLQGLALPSCPTAALDLFVLKALIRMLQHALHKREHAPRA